jgi:predicted transcriptional regulator
VPEDNENDAKWLSRAAHVAAAYLGRNHVAPADIPSLVRSVHSALVDLSRGNLEQPIGSIKPAVPIKKSVGDKFVICLEDGKKLTMLKRYLKTHHGMTPEEYRRKWNLPYDYPMVAPAYARQRSAFAKKSGLGRSPTKRPRRK